MYKFELKGAEGTERFDILQQAILMAQRPPSVEEWDDALEVVREIKRLGVPSAKSAGGIQLYDLCQDGGEFCIQRGGYKLLKNLLDQPMWRFDTIERVDSVKKWYAAQREVPNVKLEKKEEAANTVSA